MNFWVQLLPGVVKLGVKKPRGSHGQLSRCLETGESPCPPSYPVLKSNKLWAQISILHSHNTNGLTLAQKLCEDSLTWTRAGEQCPSCSTCTTLWQPHSGRLPPIDWENPSHFCLTRWLNESHEIRKNYSNLNWNLMQKWICCSLCKGELVIIAIYCLWVWEKSL